MATLYILYGSATGNAEFIAKDLAAKGPPAPFTSVVCDALEKFKKHADNVWTKPPTTTTTTTTSSKHSIIIVCSTTGNGDAPENASRFQRYVKRKSTMEAQAFQYCQFAVLGLGDTNYDIFCGAAKAIDKNLVDCGGTRVKALVCADEATGLEDTVEPWTATILADMTQACLLSADHNNNKNPAVNGNSSIAAATTNGIQKEETPTAKTKVKLQAQPTKEKILDKSLQSESPLFILYGSATGNAEQIAKDLTETYQMYLKNPDVYTYFSSVVCGDLNSWRKQCLPIWEQQEPGTAKHGLVIVTSTTGNADAPENADRFVRWLKRKPTAAAMPFQHVGYSVLALGDTNYDVFCATGKFVDKKLLELGGTRAKQVACADEATGLEETVDPWVASIFMDITLACQGSSSGVDAGGTDENSNGVVVKQNGVVEETKPQQPAARVSKEEEKKMDVGDRTTSATTNGKTSVTPQSIILSTGARTVCSIVGFPCDAPLDEVDKSCLPKIGSSLSSCQLLTQLEQEQSQEQSTSADDDRLTVSSASSSGIHYTLKRPFESSILQARYLTTTSDDAARKAADLMSSGWRKTENPNNNSSNGKANDNDDSTNNNNRLIQQAMDIYSDHFPLTVSDATSQDSTERNAKRVIELTLALPDDFTLEYTPGDSLGLIVDNLPEAVEYVLNMLRESQGILPEQHVSIDNGNPITVREAMQREIDLCAPLKSKRILSSLAQHATDCEDRKALQLLASKTAIAEKAFDEFVDKQRLSVIDILREFPSCQGIPLTALLSILPGIPPRYYSVSSSPLMHQKVPSLTVSFSVVDYVTPSLLDASQTERGLRRKKGIATRYLEALASPFLAGNSSSSIISKCLKIFPKPTAEFRMPTSLATPMVLIGPGTGIGKSVVFLKGGSVCFC